MFFDPLGKRVQFSGDHTGRRPVQRHPLLRLLAALIVLAVLIGDALIHVVRPAAVQSRGWDRRLLGRSVLLGDARCRGGDPGHRGVAPPRVRLPPRSGCCAGLRLLVPHRQQRVSGPSRTGAAVGAGDRARVTSRRPLAERGNPRGGEHRSAGLVVVRDAVRLCGAYDTLLGHPVKLRLPAEEVVAFVVYPELAVYELITFAEYHAAAAIPIRRTWLLLLPGEASDGPLREEQWTDALKGRAHIFCLYDVKRWRGTGHAGHAWSLLHPFFDGVCCSARGPRAASRNSATSLRRRANASATSQCRTTATI